MRIAIALLLLLGSVPALASESPPSEGPQTVPGGRLTVKFDGRPLEIVIDGFPTNQSTPGVFEDFRAGEHLVTLLGTEYAIEAAIVLVPGSSLTLCFSSGSASKTLLRLAVPNSTAEVSIDGNLIGSTPIIYSVAPGWHSLKVQCSGCKTVERMLLVNGATQDELILQEPHHHRIRVTLLPGLEYAYSPVPRLWIGMQIYGVNIYVHFVEGSLFAKGVHFGGGLGIRYSLYDPGEKSGFELAAAIVAEIGDYGPLPGQTGTPPPHGLLIGAQLGVTWRYQWFGAGLQATMGHIDLGGSSGVSIGVAPIVFVQHEF